MDHTYRRLYGTGGAIDRLSALYALRGLGSGVERDGDLFIATASTQADYIRDTQGARFFPAPAPGGSYAQTTERCTCMIDPLGVDANLRPQLETLCAQDPEAFANVLREQGYDPEEGCKPWYARKKTLMIGGGLALAGVAAWLVLR